MGFNSGFKGLNLNGSNILVVVVVKDFIVCFLIVSKHALSPKIFRSFSIFMHVWIFNFQACYRKNAWYFHYEGLCAINNTRKHYTEIISCNFVFHVRVLRNVSYLYDKPTRVHL